MSARTLPGPPHEQRNAPQLAVDRGGRLAEEVVLAQVVAVVGAQHDSRGVRQSRLVDGLEQPAQPVVDHGQLGPVVVAEVASPDRVEQPAGQGVDEVRRPDGPLGTLLVAVVERGPRLGGVERFVGVELVDHEEEPVVVRRRAADPLGGRSHGARTGEVLLATEPGPGVVVPVVVRGSFHRQGGRARPGRVRCGPPRVVLVAALVAPGREVGVVVLPAGLEQVGMVGDEHGGDPVAPQGPGDGVLPDLDRPPRAPGEVEGADEDVVPGRHARERSGVVPGEAQRGCREGVDGGGGELVPAVGPEHPPVEAVEQDDDQVVGSPTGPAPSAGSASRPHVVHGCLPGVADICSRSSPATVAAAGRPGVPGPVLTDGRDRRPPRPAGRARRRCCNSAATPARHLRGARRRDRAGPPGGR